MPSRSIHSVLSKVDRVSVDSVWEKKNEARKMLDAKRATAKRATFYFSLFTLPCFILTSTQFHYAAGS